MHLNNLFFGGNSNIKQLRNNFKWHFKSSKDCIIENYANNMLREDI